MATQRLTKTVVEATDAGAADAYIWDAVLPRFGLRVTPAGARIYLVQYRVKPAAGQTSKTRRLTIGRHGQPWTLEQARDEARRILARVDLGGDPFADRTEQREDRLRKEVAARLAEEEAARRRVNTFRALVEAFSERRAVESRTWMETKRLLRHDPMSGEDSWADRHIGDISRSDVAGLLDRIRKRSPAVARATYAALRAFFGWCAERGLIVASPCERLTAPPRPTARDRVLSDEELREIWAASAGLGDQFEAVVKLLMLTGQRRGEVAGMAWSELDLDQKTWRIPASRTKNGKAHEIDLSPEAMAIVEGVPKIGPLLFPARGEGAVRGFSATKRKLDALIEKARAEKAAKSPQPEAVVEPQQEWRIHDLRRTAATGMAALAFPPHVIERVLNHVSGVQGGLVGVYQRHEYRPERKAALTAWGAHVAAVVAGREPDSNILQFKGAAQA